jgi:hypothetical protein
MIKANPTLREVLARAVVIALAYAAAHTHEVGGNNAGDQVEFYLRMVGLTKGQPWCCAFVYTCLVKAYAQLMGLAEDRDSLLRLRGRFANIYGLPATGACRTLWLALKGRNLATDRRGAVRANSLAFFDFDDTGQAHHIVFVTADSAAGEDLQTVGGNTPAGHSGNQREGDGVHSKTFGRGKVFGFGQAS